MRDHIPKLCFEVRKKKRFFELNEVSKNKFEMKSYTNVLDLFDT